MFNTQQIKGNYWVGSDGNVYTKTNSQAGVQKVGPASYALKYPMEYGLGGLTQISDPNPPQATRPTANDNSSAGTGGGSTGGGGIAYDAQAATNAREKANTIGMIDQELSAIDRSLGNLDGTWNAGRNQITDAKNKGLSRLNEQQSNALSGYATKRADSEQGFQTSIADNNNQAYNNYSALQSLLGRGGSGSSSAAENLVPYAVSRTASKARGAIADTYGKNTRDLNTAEEQTKQSYNNSVADLNDQERTNLGSLENDIQSKRSAYLNQQASLKGQKAQAQGGNWNTVKNAMSGSIQQRDAIDAALSTLLDRYRNPYNVKDVTVTTPTLDNYAIDTTGVKANDPAGTGTDTDTSAAYLQQLKDEEKRKKDQLSVA